MIVVGANDVVGHLSYEGTLMGRKIAYGKIGRSMPLTLAKCGNLGGDVEMIPVIKELALRHPEDEFYLMGRNTGEHPTDVGLPPNVVNPWIKWGPVLRNTLNRNKMNHGSLSVIEQKQLREIFNELTLPTIMSMDGIVMWIGQHGTTNLPLPSVSNAGQTTKPQDFSAYYVSFLVDGINQWRDVDPMRREEVWLNADSRNYLKMRDLAWPMRNPVLAQFTYAHKIRHEREQRDLGAHWPSEFGAREMEKGGQLLWESTVSNVYSRLEVNGLVPDTPFGNLISYSEDHDRPGDFGLFINEARSYVNQKVARKNIMRDWILPLDPHFIHGTWSATSMRQLNRQIAPAPWEEYYPKLHSVRCTLTTPSSGSGWATAKPWEAFAAGTVCFFHPDYDTQDNILGDAPAELRSWLRVKNREELRTRIEHLATSPSAWRWIIRAQRDHFDAAIKELRYMTLIEERLYG